MNILITLPFLKAKGGVSSYYNSVLPILANDNEVNVYYLEVGTDTWRWNGTG